MSLNMNMIQQCLDKEGNVYSVMKGYKMINIGDLKEDEKF